MKVKWFETGVNKDRYWGEIVERLTKSNVREQWHNWEESLTAGSHDDRRTVSCTSVDNLISDFLSLCFSIRRCSPQIITPHEFISTRPQPLIFNRKMIVALSTLNSQLSFTLQSFQESPSCAIRLFRDTTRYCDSEKNRRRSRANIFRDFPYASNALGIYR
jgi:hypothetical protein